MKIIGSFLVILMWWSAVFSQGRIFIPERPENMTFEPVYLKTVRAAVSLKDGAGSAILEQTFFNPMNVTLEGQYLFPMPGEVQINDFYLYMNGKKVKGEVLDNQEARRTYENIVRTMRDPALLEFSGYGLFKARIFPIEPKKERKVEIRYSQVLNYEGGAGKFVLPIRQTGQGKIDNFHLNLNLETRRPIAGIYSPSHRIEIVRDGNRKATVTLDADQMEADKDFILYYTLEEQEISGTLLSFRPRTDRDGYFMFFAIPAISTRSSRDLPQDVIFVIDVSGSMRGEKLNQAREALRFCVNSLDENDRFNIIRFSSGIDVFNNSMVRVNDDNRRNALYYLDNMSATGGTNIDAALQRAFQIKQQRDHRPTTVIFLTDGLPTEGETDIGRILQNVESEGKEFIRIFTFGVGFDVNTFLLDKLSQQSHGSANYVKPGENIEREVSGLFGKIASPVMTDVRLEFANVQVYDVFPQKLPDIFEGQRAIIFGRYRQSGSGEIRLSGRQDNQERSFNYSVRFQEREQENDFIASLWANRKVMHLLSEIRYNGENQELVESIKALGEEYGIVTPYTSYLVTEQTKEIAGLRSRSDGSISQFRLESRQNAREAQADLDEEAMGSARFLESLAAAPMAISKSSGKGAVLASRAMKKMSGADQAVGMLVTRQRIGEKTFRLKDGVWVDISIVPDNNPDREIKFLSDEYFLLLDKNPELNRIFALGENLLFEFNGAIYRIISRETDD